MLKLKEENVYKKIVDALKIEKNFKMTKMLKLRRKLLPRFFTLKFQTSSEEKVPPKFAQHRTGIWCSSEDVM